MRTGKWAIGLTLVAVVLMFSGAAIAVPHSDNVGCGACHVPHKALKASATDYGVPLWNPGVLSDTGGVLPTYTVYSSPNFTDLGITVNQPDGPSKLCLGCHDGSYTGGTVPMADSKKFSDAGAMNLATSHPVSFVYNTALSTNPNLRFPGSLRDPSTYITQLGGTIKADLLDASDKVQCTSCHDVHTSAVAGTKALKFRYSGTSSSAAGHSDLCITCHNK